MGDPDSSNDSRPMLDNQVDAVEMVMIITRYIISLNKTSLPGEGADAARSRGHDVYIPFP